MVGGLEPASRVRNRIPHFAFSLQDRFFAGLTVKESAEVLGVTEKTVRRHWNYAKAWLYREVAKGDTRSEDEERT